MSKIYLVVAILVATGAGFLINNVINDGNDAFYKQPSSFQDGFMAGCEEDGQRGYCECAWDELSSRYSSEEIASLAREVDDGNIPDEAWGIVSACLGEYEIR